MHTEESDYKDCSFEDSSFHDDLIVKYRKRRNEYSIENQYLLKNKQKENIEP